ncbi:MAG: plasmid stabilization system protein ParE [Crocinitomicaceae bacterium]|jgi:plasmid stabilization system protein ParE
MKTLWSKEADETLDEIYDSIERRFTAKEVDSFALMVHETIRVIENHPKSFPAFSSKRMKTVRKAVIHPHSTLFYRIDSKTQITLITFWDNRQDPSKIK